MKQWTVLGLAIVLCGAQARGQGCSDAGFCTAGAMQSMAAKPQEYRNQLGLGLSIGQGERSTTIVIPQLEYRRSLGKSAFLELKLPVYFASGNLGNNAGIGDPVLTYTRQLMQGKRASLSATGGLRIGTGDASATDDKGNALPMPYQRSLGTTDLILGLSLGWGPYLSFAAGWQQPLVQYNRNGYAAGSDPERYFASEELRRKGDILLRADGHYNIGHWKLSAGPLLIAHLGNDEATDATGKTYTLTGSDGITLNLAFTVQYTLQRFTARIAGGAPAVVRDVRPDGLTRSWIITPALIYSF